jgi:RimJ/RimL family protein N-acetyltransferase
MKSIILKNGSLLTLRKVKKSDAFAMLEYLKLVGNESDNLTFGSEGIPLELAEETAFLEKVEAMEYYTMMIGIIDDQIVSAGSLMGNPRIRLRHNAEIGISVKKAYWNQGIAKAMLNELIDFAKKNQVVTMIHLSVRTDNTYAIHLYESLGFKHSGIFPRQLYINNHYYDTFLMTLDLNA